MLSTEHQQAQELASKAAAALQCGRKQEALRLYARAARLEGLALAQIPSTAIRTKGILAVSLVSMLYKAKNFSAAEKAIFLHLGQSGLLLPAQTQLRELLEVVEDERSRSPDLAHESSG